MSSPSSVVNKVAMPTAARAAETRKSIKKYCTLGTVMARGKSNPITIHCIDDDLFCAVWALVGELMYAESELPRSAKEAIGREVSAYNACNICMTVHEMMHVGAVDAKQEKLKQALREMASTSADTFNFSDEDELERQAIDYAVSVQEATHGNGVVPSEEDAACDFPMLTAKQKVEVALVVLLFEHMNRVVHIIMGQEMSSAMFGIPKPIAKQIEKKKVMVVVNRMMLPFMKGSFRRVPKVGFTAELFKGDINKNRLLLPCHLQEATLAGPAVERALAHFTSLSEGLYTKSVHVFVPGLLVPMLDTAILQSKGLDSNPKLIERLQEKVAIFELSKQDKAVAMALLVSSINPRLLHKSNEWKLMVKAVGSTRSAHLVIMWWSVRLTVKRAKGLESAISKSSVIQCKEWEQ